MAETKAPSSMPRRAFANAVRIALVVCIVACGIQAAAAYFDRPPATDLDPTTVVADLGSWTFAGEGLAVSMTPVAPEALAEKLSASAPLDGDPPALADGEARLLELLATLGSGEEFSSGRRRWRQAFAGIEAYAETRRVEGRDRLTVARAVIARPEGPTILEIRPADAAGGNGKSANGAFVAVAGAKQVAKRVSANGETTGELLMTEAAPEKAAADMKQSLKAEGWAIDDLALGEGQSGAAMACRRENEQMHVVVFSGDLAGQTMILAVRE